MHSTYVGSQPIYTRELGIYAYQLLFRNNEYNKAQFSDGDKATSELILNSLTDIGLDKLVGTHKACINFTRNFLLGEYPIPSMKRQIVIEVQEGTLLDEAVIAALHQLSAKGFTLAIPEPLYRQHFICSTEHPYIVKFDITQYYNGQLVSAIAGIKQDNVHLLAEKIETQQEFKVCNEMGFDYYQGFFFCEPNIVKGRGIPANKVQIVRLLQKLQDDETDNKEIDQLISADVSLCYRLLRYANSSMLGLNTRIESIQHAISILGWDTIRMIATLLALSSIDDKPGELIHIALIRAKLCEELAKYKHHVDQKMAFTAGLLSILESLLDTPMDQILAKLPLNPVLTRALLDLEGELGELLQDSIIYVHGKPEYATSSRLDATVLRENYLKALVWANATLPALQS